MKFRLLVATLIAAAAIAGCKHETFKPIGGKGGNALLAIYPRHHDTATYLDSMVVYIKYNTLDAPADGKYDDSATCIDMPPAPPTCTFGNLWNGNYYIFATGFDVQYNERVKGGFGYTIKSQQPVTLFLPVSELSH